MSSRIAEEGRRSCSELHFDVVEGVIMRDDCINNQDDLNDDR